MDRLPRYRHLIGLRHDRVAEAPNDIAELQKLFSLSIPTEVQEFLTTLSDSILYYCFDAQTKSGKAKRYSHFVLTNIGPELQSYHPFPASLIGIINRYRGMGLPDGYLPIMLDFGKNAWLWCRLTENGASVVIPKGDHEFGSQDKDWNVIAETFDQFIQGLSPDLSPHLSVFRLAGTGNVSDNMREWFRLAIGEDWESQVQTRLSEKRATQKRPGTSLDKGL